MSSSSQFTVGSSMAGNVRFLTGNTGGPVGPDGANNINVVGTGLVTVTGDPGTNTLTISVNNSGTATAVTVDDTPEPIISIALATDSVVTVIATINALNSPVSDSFGGTIVATAYRAAGDVQLVGVPNILSNTTSSANISGTVNTGTQELVISVIGLAAETWNWSATYQYLVS